MGAPWTSWITTIIVIILQIQGLISVKIKTVTGVEGKRFDFTCEYKKDWQNNAKYFVYYNSSEYTDHLIRTDKHNQWVRKGRFSLYDNTSHAFFIVSVDTLVSGDSGMYQCGVDITSHPHYIGFIQLNVSRATATPPKLLTHHITTSPVTPKDLSVDKLHLPLYLAAVMCMAAILTVCLFTLCLLVAVKHRRSTSRRTREASSDYETMMPGVTAGPEQGCNCTALDCPGLSAPLPPPPDPYSDFTLKQRESTVSVGEYCDVDVPEHTCQYQHLDLSQLEHHVYHSINGSRGPKDRSVRVKQQTSLC